MTARSWTECGIDVRKTRHRANPHGEGSALWAALSHEMAEHESKETTAVIAIDRASFQIAARFAESDFLPLAAWKP